MLELEKILDFTTKNLADIINRSNIDKFFIYGNKIMETFSSIKNKKKETCFNP